MLSQDLLNGRLPLINTDGGLAGTAQRKKQKPPGAFTQSADAKSSGPPSARARGAAAGRISATPGQPGKRWPFKEEGRGRLPPFPFPFPSRGRGRGRLPRSSSAGQGGLRRGSAAGAMRWLGQPCALPPLLLPRGPLQALGGRVAWDRAAGAGGSLRAGAARAGGAAPGLLRGQEQPSRAAGTQPPGRGPRLPRRLLRESGPLRPPARFWLPAAAAAGPLRGGSEPLCRPPSPLRPARAWQTTRSFSAGGEDCRGGGPRSDLAPREATGTPPENPNQENGKKPSKSQQLKKIFKEYGAVGVTFHIGISLMSLGMFYLVVSSGVDMTTVLFKLGFDEALVRSKLAAGTSTFVLAYAIHKLFAPVRISITVISVPFLVRYFRKIGFFKPPAPNP